MDKRVKGKGNESRQFRPIIMPIMSAMGTMDYEEEMEERIPRMGQANLIIPNNNDRYMVIQNEVVKLRQMVLNGQNGVRRLARHTFQKPYPAHIDDVQF
ncbi:hypothetical protein Pyn_19641 [Prunus yedoensis var. nudiflora]|uniref:Uncharacterized protein n=1 Tax=Prunus yedoensis var. nudiflora TaxID=2094558 RepID=A0A314Y8K3_PRUYE|nr:hypothetical protein Pyn_19641 [Prunus yedoensis var. nudiflora]